MALGWRVGYLRYKEFFLNILLVTKKRPDVKLFLEATLSLITILVFSIFALRPTLLTIASLVKEIKTKEEIVETMDEKIANLDAAESLYAQEETRINTVKEAVPVGAAPEVLLRQLEGVSLTAPTSLLGASFGEIVLSGKEPEKKTKEDLKALPEGAKSLTFSVSVTGDYFALSKFLADMEALRMPIKIDASGLNSSPNQEGTTLTLVISARTPYIQNEQE